MATILTEPYNCTFIHIPKTGGNSITDWLKENATTKTTKRKQHATLQQVINGNHSLGPLTRQELGWTFCVVRNPWNWCVSWYTFELELAKIYVDKLKNNLELEKKRKSKYNLELQKHRAFHLESIGFEGYLTEFKKLNQHHWAHECDYVLKLENINNDFLVVQEKINCFTPLPIKNKTINRTSYQDYYTPKLKDIVYKKYKTDINTYNYEFD
jgi:hypothetical protein